MSSPISKKDIRDAFFSDKVKKTLAPLYNLSEIRFDLHWNVVHRFTVLSILRTAVARGK